MVGCRCRLGIIGAVRMVTVRRHGGGTVCGGFGREWIGC